MVRPYIEEDRTAHQHKAKVSSQQQQTGSNRSTTVVSEGKQLRIINAKLERMISVVEKIAAKLEVDLNEATNQQY